ncbi:AAA domain-containing protein [Halapricum desulfuricans]|uniref:DNA helicase n=1 Tax=Halapricum desulfuricans TaxID=2841257 RepID=A0A897N1X7_9EURY|nr:AAA domain-containing protein [Halapricum desulfuricans]QSG06218.1 UvrD/REP helicase [Halapricum desulfuricans]
MNVRGVVVETDDPETVSTQYGERELCEVTVRPDRGRGEPTTVTLWGDWVENAEQLESGMELAVYDAEKRTYQGETQYTTGSDTTVVVEPEFVVDVTDIRAWVQCPRMYYLNKIDGLPLAYPVVKGTIVHEVFGDLLRGRDLDTTVEEQVEAAGLELGLLGRDSDSVAEDVRDHASAIEGWLAQGTLTERDEWRSEMTLISERYGIKGRADAVRRGMPVELKTGKNTRREPRFHDKIQAAAYALILGERAAEETSAASMMGDGGATVDTDTPSALVAAPDTGTLLYTKNAAVDRAEEGGDLSPAKEFSIGSGLLEFVLRARNAIAATEYGTDVPTGYEGDAKCEYCFEQDTCMAVSGRLGQESKAGQVGSPIPERERAYFDRFYRAIEAERRAVHREYAKLWRQGSTERADDDRALVDLQPLGRREIDGGRWELRAAGTGATSKIREGDVVLASDGHPIRGEAELARVERLGGSSPDGDSAGDEPTTGQEIVVTADEPVELRRLDIYPSELSTDRLLTALHDAVLKQPQSAKDVLFGRRDPEFDTSDATFVDNNPAQDEAVRRAVGAEDFALVHGPPGTGKTYTLAKIVRELVDRGERVLLSAFTNRAVDNAIEALVEQGFTDVVRVGTESGVREDMQRFRLEQAGDPDELASRLEDAPVVAATTASCGSRVVREQRFDAAVVDEAGQLTEPGTLAATNLADRFVLIGDHQQLPPVVRSEDSGTDGKTGSESGGQPRADLGRSLFERLIEDHPEAGVLLDRQYRMAQRIQAFPSQAFYDGQLRPATGEVASRHVGDLEGVDPSALPERLRGRVAFVDPDGHAHGNTNPEEADAVAQVVEEFASAGVSRDDIGVIAPYRAQVAEIDQRLDDDVAVDTVDRFQGSSKEVIVVSFVATGDLDGPIFEDYRRINVALSRAKRSLVLVGDADALSTDETYAEMVEWAL